jgi:hypothetical protein
MHPDLSVRMHRHLHCRRGHENRIPHPGAEHLAGEIHAARIDGFPGHQIHPGKGLAVTADGELGAVAMGGVVVGQLRDVGEEDGLEVERASHLVESGDPPVLLQ